MDKKTEKSGDLSLKQKNLLYFYKSKQWIYNNWLKFRRTLNIFIDSTLFYILVFSVILFFIHKGLVFFRIAPSSEDLRGLGFAIAGIIGASIAIIFASDDLTRIIAMFDTGESFGDLDNILETVNDAWNYFPHKVLGGISPAEQILNFQKHSKKK